MAEGKESDVRSLDLAAFVDASLKALEGRSLLRPDWQRSRSIRTRIGDDRIHDATAGTRSLAENRGIISLYNIVSLPRTVVLESRVRADLRWTGGNYSNRYRVGVQGSREFTVVDHTVVPYFNVECFYDTRYDGWARTLYQPGSEITESEHFRLEIFLAHQVDRLPKPSSLNAIGFVAKWYY